MSKVTPVSTIKVNDKCCNPIKAFDHFAIGASFSLVKRSLDARNRKATINNATLDMCTILIMRCNSIDDSYCFGACAHSGLAGAVPVHSVGK